MRLKFWQSEKASVPPAQAAATPAAAAAPPPQAAAARTATPRVKPAPAEPEGVATGGPAGVLGDLDLRLIWNALVRNKAWIIIPTAIVAALSFAVVNLITPRFKSEARIVLDGRENVFLRPTADRVEERRELDAEAITSQVQIVLSRDLAREIIRKNKLNERPEFDPVLQGMSPFTAMAALLGIVRDPLKLSPEERVLDAYYERLTAYAVDKSRVIVVEFQSRDPELAARVANSIAEGYIAIQQSAKQDQARSASTWLAGEIESLRKKVTDAEAKVEDFRGKASLFVGTNNTTLSNQQMGEVNTQLSNARAQKSDSESKARSIRSMLQSGQPIEASEVLNSEMVRRLGEQRATLRAQLAEQSSTLLDGHPRIKELRAQISDLDRQLRDEASKISRSLENDAKIAGARLESLGASLDQLKKQATSTNNQDVQLRALEREARAQRELLESYLAEFREATTRENLESAPNDARIISRAIVSNIPAYPKKLPVVLIATLATLMLTAGSIVTGELLKMTSPRGPATVVATGPAPAPAPGRRRRSCSPCGRSADPSGSRCPPRSPGACRRSCSACRRSWAYRGRTARARRRRSQDHRDGRLGCRRNLADRTDARAYAGARVRRGAGRHVEIVDLAGCDGRCVGAGLERSRGRHGVVRANHRQGPDVARADHRQRFGQGGCRDVAVAAPSHDHRRADARLRSRHPGRRLARRHS